MKLMSHEVAITAAVTDVLLALSAVTASAILLRQRALFGSEMRQKAFIWAASFFCVGMSAGMGSFIHAFEMTKASRDMIWQPLNLSLGAAVSLFAAGVLLDLRRARQKGAVVGTFLFLAVLFYGFTVLVPGTSLVFVAYEALAMVFALCSYIYMSVRRKDGQSAWMSLGIAVSMLATVLLEVGNLSFRLGWTFDRFGIFHIVQMVGIALLMRGLLPVRAAAGSPSADEVVHAVQPSA